MFLALPLWGGLLPQPDWPLQTYAEGVRWKSGYLGDGLDEQPGRRRGGARADHRQKFIYVAQMAFTK